MPHRISTFLLLALCVSVPDRTNAGAFVQAAGYGQFIAGVGVSESSRTFDRGGRPQPTPAYREAIASGYLEWGLTSWLTVVAAPTLAHANGVAANSVTGSDSSAFGGRFSLYQSGDRALSLQTLVQPPLAPGSTASQLANGGARAFAVDVRLMYAQSFTIHGMVAFFDVAPGARIRADPFPTEARLDVTLGVRPVPWLLLLAQNFVSSAPQAGPRIERTAYDKIQGSVVYDVSPRWSVQLGAFHTVAGINAVRESGPMGALWVRW